MKRESCRSYDIERDGEREKEERIKEDSDDGNKERKREDNGRVDGALQCQQSHFRDRRRETVNGDLSAQHLRKSEKNRERLR